MVLIELYYMGKSDLDFGPFDIKQISSNERDAKNLYI
jgi:hypothetical protein